MHGSFEPTDDQRHRVIRRHNDWTLKEHEVVVSHWPDIDEITKRLPHRTRAAICNFAGRCNLRKQIHLWTDEEHSLLRRRVREGVPQREIAKELGLNKLQITNRIAYTGLSYPRRPPKPTGNPLIDTIRRRAFDLNVSMKELDEACNSGKQFEKYSAQRRIHIKHIARAAKVLDGNITIQWSEK